jgi:hypothetical protein
VIDTIPAKNARPPQQLRIARISGLFLVAILSD